MLIPTYFPKATFTVTHRCGGNGGGNVVPCSPVCRTGQEVLPVLHTEAPPSSSSSIYTGTIREMRLVAVTDQQRKKTEVPLVSTGNFTCTTQW